MSEFLRVSKKNNRQGIGASVPQADDVFRATTQVFDDVLKRSEEEEKEDSGCLHPRCVLAFPSFLCCSIFVLDLKTQWSINDIITNG